MTDLIRQLATLLLAGLATSAISLTIANAKVFKPLRKALRLNYGFLAELLSCAYCVSHWIAFGWVLLLWQNMGVESMVLYGFAIVGIAAIASGIIVRTLGFGPTDREEELARALEEARRALRNFASAQNREE